jgi:hypothetical protein
MVFHNCIENIISNNAGRTVPDFKSFHPKLLSLAFLQLKALLWDFGAGYFKFLKIYVFFLCAARLEFD